jgi:sulfur-carrier protein
MLKSTNSGISDTPAPSRYRAGGFEIGAKMQITVKLFASFRNGRFKVAMQELPAAANCLGILQDLGLSEDEIGVVLVNGRHASLEHVLLDGDTLALFPLVGGG